MKKRIITAVAVGGITFGGVFAFAATMNLSSDSLGADQADVENACDATVSYSNVAYTAASAGYEVDEVTVTPSDADDCAGKTFEVTLADGTTAKWQSGAEAFATPAVAVPVAVGDPVKAAEVNDAYAVVTGP